MAAKRRIEVKIGGHPSFKRFAVALRRDARLLLQALHFNNVIISVTLVCDAEMADLNQIHMGHQGTTDVLSFPQLSGFKSIRSIVKKAEKGAAPLFLGDIVICMDEAGRNAKTFHRLLGEELRLYLAHGILHLLGYADKPKSQYVRMVKKQSELCRKAFAQGAF